MHAEERNILVGMPVRAYPEGMKDKLRVWVSSEPHRVKPGGDTAPNCNTPSVTVAATIHLQFSTLFLQWLLEYKPNSREMTFSIIEVGSFEVNWKV
jgi:hypothetical protein